MDTPSTKLITSIERATPVQRVDASFQKKDTTAQTAKAIEAVKKSQENQREDETTRNSETLRYTLRIDKDAGRFVSAFLDINTDLVVRQFPTDAQLAYSRAVRAYLKATT